MNINTYYKQRHFNVWKFFLLSCVLWITFIFVTIIVALPTNPLSLNVDKQRLIQQTYPQGWGFFSANPREESLNIYDLETDKQATNWPNNKISNLFGLYRYGRSQGIELGHLTAQVPNSSTWSTCEKGLNGCPKLDDQEFTIHNESPNPTLCGEFAIVKEKPVPWAWAKYEGEHVRVSKMIKVSAICSKRR
ncbi:SdpA family antimicrobial peptide system protein [Priestia megaterium]|uniref:SdpA family antimicrobial peptide system protein n=1 Tax=Priestia megaterium TaxID=1404 RepID=UPI0028777B34|nr:SdpA family antimicrobial peptide system protein [Priestia megaterium]MBX4163797.1 SdpA family antimicrobial peptide system protein [Priestia megaterium]